MQEGACAPVSFTPRCEVVRTPVSFVPLSIHFSSSECVGTRYLHVEGKEEEQQEEEKKKKFLGRGRRSHGGGFNGQNGARGGGGGFNGALSVVVEIISRGGHGGRVIHAMA